MGIVEIIFLGLGLSFDTFAVSVSTGLLKNSIRFWQGVRVAVVLAFFQALMPLLGWFGGTQVASYISEIDHWIAFGLLSVVGIKMIIEAFKAEEDKKNNSLSFRVLVLMGIATSMDALVVGVSLAFFEIRILQSIVIIGFITFLAAMIGMLIGKSSNKKSGKKIEIVGGVLLIGIGLKILMEHII
ncbi:putative manganese efflux pump MntP [bioreactor metagenome]|jgi:putative Mn2+ efflux pump MntP|uniref:Putative manganese efflux pump MntP n=1 Tax=bioreactor metagenome TaxID=1076179 RepID=A0A644VCX5_9ZZZZ|nr:manganese efflux pump MntP family protein [Paludibacter sp.]